MLGGLQSARVPGRDDTIENLVRCLMAGPVIDYQNFVDIRFQDGAEFFVGRIDKVGVAVFVGGEGEKEAVSVALGQIFRADVSAPLEIFDLFYFCGERAKGGFDLLDLVGRAAVFKFEEDYVAQDFFVGGVLLRKSSCEEAQQECSERKNCVHGEHFRQDRVERQWGGFGTDCNIASVAIPGEESQMARTFGALTVGIRQGMTELKFGHYMQSQENSSPRSSAAKIIEANLWRSDERRSLRSRLGAPRRWPFRSAGGG
jgi:hypothetical protein